MKIIHIHHITDIIYPASADGKKLVSITAKSEQRATAWADRNNLSTIWYSRAEKLVYGFMKVEK